MQMIHKARANVSDQVDSIRNQIFFDTKFGIYKSQSFHTEPGYLFMSEYLINMFNKKFKNLVLFYFKCALVMGYIIRSAAITCIPNYGNASLSLVKKKVVVILTTYN